MFRQGERRKEDRVCISAPCLLTWEGHRLNGRTVDLSQGGASIARTLTLPPEGARVQLTILWSGAHRLSGRVPYCVPVDEAAGSLGRFGVEFDGTGDHARFGRFLAAHA